MKKNYRWIIISVIVLLSLFIGTMAWRWKSLPWSPGYITSTPFIPPVEEIPPTATIIIPSASTPTFFIPSTSTPTVEPDRVWLDPALPLDLQEELRGRGDLLITDDLENTGTSLTYSEENPLAYWVLVAAVPFPTVQDGLTLVCLQCAWQGCSNPLASTQPLLMSGETRDILAAIWGEPAPGAVEIIDKEELSSQAWSRRPSLAILPFEDLEPSWKVLRVDGISPLQGDFNPMEYGLALPISALGTTPELLQGVEGNWDREKMTTVVLTGVTALVRATAWTMEIKGINYPAVDILDYLVEADILHISNEVPFAQDCPYPDPDQKDLRFCSDSRYIELMETIGTDVVELTGDHFSDYGTDALFYTLELYNERGWPYYGGGSSRQDAQEPVLLEHNGNKIAFLGCNAKGGGYARASDGYPGAVACDFPKMVSQIQELVEEGYNPIATFQHYEYYAYEAQYDQIRDARILSNAGAVIVSGSQAHQPQGLEIRDGSFIHHGLGNLFFDQNTWFPPNTASAFIDRHIFYNGKHISTELLTIWFIDSARARPMTQIEREELLQIVFDASGW